QVGGVKMYLNWFGRFLAAFRADDGKLLWKYSQVANGTANIPTPIVKGDIVFTSTGYQKGLAVLQLLPKNDGVEVKELYFTPGNRNESLQNHHGGMVLVGDHVYFGNGHNDGVPTCVEFKTGKVAWQQSKRPGNGSACILFADGRLYMRNQDGTMN